MRADKKIGSPSNKEGNEGEVSLRREYGGKTSIFGKINGLWRKVGVDILGSPPDGSFPLFKSNTKLYTNGRLSFKNGTVDFRSKLKVSGSVTANNSNFRIADDAEDDDWSIGSDSSDSYKFKIDKHSDVGGNTKFAIDKYGRVGIGESSPLSSLHVKDSNNSRTITDNLTTGFRNGIVINNSSEVRGTYSNLDFKAGKAYGRIAFDYNSPNYGDFHFITEEGRAAYTRMSIKSTGRVGIGTTSPSSTLDVDGTISFGKLFDTDESIRIDKFVDEADGIGSNDNDITIPTSAAVKDYVDTNVTAQDLDVATDTGTIDIDLDSEALTVSGGEGINTSATGTAITIGAEDASDSNKGVVELATTAETTTGTDTARAVTPDGLKDGYRGSTSVVTTGALSSGSITSGFGAIDVGSSNITTTGDGSFGAITSGAVVWQSFPFILISSVNGRYYFIDVDDTANSYRRWDAYDTDPTGFNYRSVGGQFVVPENCTLIAMHGVIANNSSTNNPTVSIYHGTVTEGTGDTTLALAAGSGGGALAVTTGTLRVPFKFNDTFNVDLSAGDIVVPTISHADSGGTRSFAGSLTLKFITR